MTFIIGVFYRQNQITNQLYEQETLFTDLKQYFGQRIKQIQDQYEAKLQTMKHEHDVEIKEMTAKYNSQVATMKEEKIQHDRQMQAAFTAKTEIWDKKNKNLNKLIKQHQKNENKLQQEVHKYKNQLQKIHNFVQETVQF